MLPHYRRCREVFLKPPAQANRYNTEVRWGCPYDCGLCPDHEQHSCLTLVEICDACNLECPVCYAESGPGRPHYRTLAQVEAMLDAWSFDVRSIKKTCVHIVHTDGRLIPFDTYNLFYRDGLEQSRLAPLRAELEVAGRAPLPGRAVPLRVARPE